MRKLKGYFSLILVALMLTGLFAISAQATSGSAPSLSPSSPGMKAYYDFEIDGPTYHDSSNTGNRSADRSALTSTLRANTFWLPNTPVNYRNFFVRTHGSMGGRLLGIYSATDDSIDAYQGDKVLKLQTPGTNGYGIGGLNYTAKKMYFFSSTIKLAGDTTDYPRFGVALRGVSNNNTDTISSGGALYVYSPSEGFYDSTTAGDAQIRTYPSDLVVKLESVSEWTTVERAFYFRDNATGQGIGLGTDDLSYTRNTNLYVDETYIREFFAGIDGDATITVPRSVAGGAAPAVTSTYSVIEASSNFDFNTTIEWSLEGSPSGISLDASTGVLTVQPYADATSVTVKARVYTKNSGGTILTDETLTKAVTVNYTGTAVPYVVNARIEGSVMAGNTIAANWDFRKASSITGTDASTVRWLVSDTGDVNGTYTEQPSVSGQPKQFAVLSTHAGKWIKAEITPKASSGEVNATVVETVPASPAVVPEAKDAYIDGAHKIGAEVEGKYTYIDANHINDLDTPLEAEDKTANGSVYEWYRYDNESDVTPNPVTPIATTKKYTLTSDDVGKFLEFRVKVKNVGGEVATDFAASTRFKGPVPPVAQSVVITGPITLGGTLKGEYTFYSEFGEGEAESSYSWVMDGREISTNASITITSEMNEKTVRFTVIPVASSEPARGEPVSAERYISFSEDNYTVSGSTGTGGNIGSIPQPPVEIVEEEPAPPKPVTPPEPEGLTDIKGHWAEETITNMTEKEILNGYEDKTFKPDASIKRNETVTMIVKAFGVQENATETEFTDVKDDAWYYSAVKTAVSNGLVSGFDGMFLPENNITRQEFAVIITNVLNLYPEITIETEEKEEFADSSEIADWAKEAVNKLNSMNIMQGFENNFSPNAPLTRAEAAVTVERLYNILGIE